MITAAIYFKGQNDDPAQTKIKSNRVKTLSVKEGDFFCGNKYQQILLYNYKYN